MRICPCCLSQSYTFLMCCVWMSLLLSYSFDSHSHMRIIPHFICSFHRNDSLSDIYAPQVLDGKQEVETLWFRTKESEELISALKVNAGQYYMGAAGISWRFGRLRIGWLYEFSSKPRDTHHSHRKPRKRTFSWDTREIFHIASWHKLFSITLLLIVLRANSELYAQPFSPSWPAISN